MGTAFEPRPIGKLRRNLSLMWKLLAILVILQASGINAKQIQNDLTFDDTFDIDQFDDAVSTNKVRSGRDLDEKAFIEDELQPVDETDTETSSNGGSWLMQSVKRVRRELGRLFGSEEKKAIAGKKHVKSSVKAERQRKRQAKQAEKQKRKAMAANVARNNNAKNRLNKRQSYDDVEGSGDDTGDAEGFGKKDLWQTLFTVNEPWQEKYSLGKYHSEFLKLEQQIVAAFQDLAGEMYGDDDDEVLSIMLMRAEPTSDAFKFHCIVQIELPEKWNNFGNEMHQYVSKYRRIGDIGADVDSSFYFKRVSELLDHEKVDVTPNADEQHHHGEGVVGSHGAVTTGDHLNPSEFGNCDVKGFFHCRNGQKIDCLFRCDQKIDCDDESDEDSEMCERFIYEIIDEDEDIGDDDDYKDSEHGGYAPPHSVTDEVAESPSYGGGRGEEEDNVHNNSYDPYAYGKAHEIERERERQRQHELEQERNRLYEEQLAREEAERERQYQEQLTREEEERKRQYDLEQQQREREEERERAEREREAERERAEKERQPERQPPSSIDYDDNRDDYDCQANPNGYFRCSNGEVIPCEYVCDSIAHCADVSDEEDCRTDTVTEAVPNITNEVFEGSGDDYAPITETSPVYSNAPDAVGCRGDATFTCPESGKVICDEQLCDDTEQCPDGEDEMGCSEDNEYAPETKCEDYEFKCDNRCLPREYLCNGHQECYDMTDELNCPDKECKPNQFQCRSGDCIDGSKRCNRVPDCPDGDDEDERCHFVPEEPLSECDIYEFECDYSSCIPIEKKCDGYPDCDDETDEIDCPPFTDNCNDNEFECDESFCILRDQQCNGVPNCNDGTDEKNCTFCREGAYLCNTGECILDNLHCNGHNDCADGSDEHNCDECPPLSMKCNDTCVDWNLRCDGNVDCYDGSDEQDCNGHDNKDKVNIIFDNETCHADQWKCDNFECIDKKLLCNGHYDCHDHSDESNKHCTTTVTTVLTPDDCSSNQFFCDDDCHPISIRCNGEYDCADRSDEEHCSRPTRRPPTYPCPQHTCANGLCYSESERCDGISQCEDGTDETGCCPSDEFRCANGDCVAGYAHCNGQYECADRSDESDCGDTFPSYPTNRCSPSQYRCDSGQCVSLMARCNGYTDCLDSSDEKYCSSAPPTASPQLNLKTYPDNQIIKESREVIFRCRDEGMLRAKVRWTRPNGRALPVGARDKDGRLEIPNIRMEDSGTYICEAVGYPRHVAGQQVSVQLTVEKFNEERIPSSACANTQATCLNGECIDKSQICDGIPHCSDGSDEHSCSHGRKCHPNQFMCRNTKCVDRVWRCDGEDDCGDHSDEESCDPEPSGAPCRYDEFQCRSGHCIPKSFQCDDTNDCQDGSDEIGCMAPDKIRDPPPTAVLPEGAPLNLTCVGVGTPTPVVVWRLNWGHVPEKCVSKSFGGTGTIYCPDMQASDSGAYSCEIINTKGSKFATDTLVTVTPTTRPGVCPAGFFNMLARRPEECINCFCFGITKSCKSAELFNYAIQPPITSHRVVDVELSPFSNIVINEASTSGIMNMRHGVQFRASDVLYGSRSAPYLALPSDYMGNQLKSYGGFIKYDVTYMGTGRPTTTPDVIVTGNGFTLTYRSRVQPQPNIVNHMEIQFTPGQWKKPDGRIATREEIMMVLANVDNVLIRLSYIEATERQVELTNILMNSAGEHDQGLGQASLIEQCSCPVGYTGDSCESCAPGYVRQSGGAWLGRCVPFTPEPCAVGTYGDPRRGIPCRECPCPQTGSNNFATGCSLGPDNEVTCNCNEGYAGRRCEYCADGYTGHPLTPGGRCFPIPETTCNAEGTYSANPDNTCTCKALVTGPRCDTCKNDSFHLNAFTYTGCIECFCSGLPTTCGSSSWYRDQISSTFGRSSAPHGFGLISHYNTNKPLNVHFVQSGNTLSFTEPRTSEPLYWQLPAQFLGNKITAYGGKLNYTLSYTAMPGGLMSRSTSPDVVIKSGEDLTIIHYRRSGVSPSSSNSYSIPIIESAWHRSDGQPVNRQHLLMALSKIDAIYIKATYTTSTKDGSLTQVTMDIATPTNLGTARAVEVEQCRCPEGYKGLSCERCAPGYKRNPEAGLYLGICEPCECNGHSTQCNEETGVCVNCADNTAGEFCERCAPGYSGDATNGTPYDCTPDGGTPLSPTLGNQTCEYCNPEGTRNCDGGYCYCKANVQGTYCDQCRPGTYGLSSDNPDGCNECYCSQKSTTCRTANLYRQFIPVDFLGNPPLLTDEEGLIADTSNLNFDIERNEYTYSYTSYTPKYWSLRGSVLGNQLYSYGGVLSYKLNVESYGHYETGHDVILIGQTQKLLWSRPSSEQDNPEYRIRLHESENWQFMDRGYMGKATRVQFMNVLSNLEHILIRATPKIPTTHTAISDVILESAVETPFADAQLATEIELCSCPPGYSGTSCESCSPMHYRDGSGNCLPCPCQDDSTSSCNLDEHGYVHCKCRSGYTGDRCQNPAGYETEPLTTVRPTPEAEYRTQITVSIAQPEITIIPVGGSIELSCTGRMAWNGSPVLVSWYKLNDDMPAGWEQSNGVLSLYNLQIHDSGVYICQARNNETRRVFEDRVTITITEDSRRTPAQIDNLPPYVTFEEYEPNEINCEVSGNPTPTVTWTRIDGRMSSEAHVDGSRLIFDMPRKSDEGNYRCQASNGVGYEEKNTQIYVRPAAPQPIPAPRELVYIEPPSFSGESGQFVRLTCQPTTPVILKYEWTKDGYPLYRQHNLIINENMLEIRDASPRDTGVYTCIGVDRRGQRNYTSDAQVVIEDSRTGGSIRPSTGSIPPTIRLPEENRVIQGRDFTITCDASGSPYPTIKWTKLHESLADNVHQTGNVLRIMNARPDNRGVYVCIAENEAGNDRSNTFIDIEPRERPIVDIDPKEPQVITVGGQAILYCLATGIPEPRVQWLRVNGQPLSPRHQIQQNEPGYVILNDALLSDAGDYKCVAENEVGNATAVTNIRVIEAPVIVLEPSQEVLSVTEGDEVKITCTATGLPNPTVRWVQEEDRYIRPFSAEEEHYNQAFLEFSRVSMQDGKAYKCIASNEAGTDERYIVLDVKPRRGDAPDDSDVDRSPYPPQITRPTYLPPQPYPENIYQSRPGENVTLDCDLSSAYKTSWTREDGRPLPPNSYFVRNSLIIHHMQENNAGKYRCTAYDSRGKIITYHLAELEYAPIPHITFNPRMPIRVNAYENIDISCDVDGAQPITVSWHTDNNRPLPPSVSIEGKYLRFIAITPAAAGRYNCFASNRFGNTTEMAEVIVNRGHIYEEAPPAKNYQLNEGQSVQISCDIAPHHIPLRGDVYYTWTREDGSRLPTNSQIRNNELYIFNVRKQDEGRYICEASVNGVRMKSSSADLYVKLGVRPLAPTYYPPPIMSTTPRMRDTMLRVDQQQSKLRVGESTEVECYSSDNSYTDVVWERADGEPLPPHLQQIGNRLIINHVTPHDAGRYVCKCKTDEGDLYTTSYELDIEASPHETKHPRIVHADVGTRAKLYCNAENSHNSPSYRWSRQYSQMQMGTDILNDQLNLADVQANDAGTYVCTATTPDGESIDYPTILVVTGAIPHFHQDPISYMSYPTLRDSYIKFNFDITFRPEKPNGLLLFNGQKKGNGDYISLSLNERYPEFRYDFDGKSMVIRSEQPVTLNEWHTIRVNRFRRDGYMQVDEQHPVAFPTLSPSSSLDLVDDLYLGGVPTWDILPHNAVDQQVGFIGCISRLTLQGSIIELMKDAKLKEGITACKPCQDNPCNNDGICLESQTEMAYTCICQQGWTGRNCAVAGTQCTPGICGTGRCENTETGMECLCPLNKTGDRCQYIEHLNENNLGFKKNSFAAYGTPRASKLNIKFQVRPNSLEDAVLLYAAESKLPSGDFVAVVLRNKHVELIINTGARLKPVVVRSLNPLPLNKWTEIEIARRFGEGILRVGTEPEQKAKAAGAARTLYIKTPLYIGGYDHERITLNRDVNVTQGFDGCVSNLYEGQRQINLIADIDDAANIQNCGEINEIEQNETFDHEEQTNNENDFATLDACASDPCENGGTCAVVEEEAVCSCSVGFAGKHCEDHITLKFDANFHGNGYLELNRSQFDENIEQKYSFAAMVFSTSDPNGLLLWWGQQKGEAYNGQDFMALAIVDGIVEFAFRLNGEEAVLRNPDKRVDDGRRHIVLIKRTDNTAILELDHVLYADETRPTGKNTMTLPGHVFIGGAPDLDSFTGGRYKNHFNGCVRVVEGESSGIIELGKVAVSGLNVDTCPEADEDNDGTEPPVV